MSRNFSYLSLDARVEQFAQQPLQHLSLKSAFHANQSVDSPTPFRCEYVLWPAAHGFVCRANSVAGYAEINRMVCHTLPLLCLIPFFPGDGWFGPSFFVFVFSSISHKQNLPSIDGIYLGTQIGTRTTADIGK
jgi:hypothetical protein